MLLIIKRRFVSFVFIVELLVIFKLYRCADPSNDNEKDAEEGPPETHSESPDHSNEFIIIRVHYSS
jgi:hypothetical protein